MNKIRVKKLCGHLLFTLALSFIHESAYAQPNCSNIFSHEPVNYPTTSNIQYTATLNQAAQRQSVGKLSPVRNLNPQITRQEGVRYYPNQKENMASVVHTIWVGQHSIEIVVPKNSGYEFAVNGTIQTVLELPQLLIESLKTVRMNIQSNIDDVYWRQNYADFHGSAANAGSREIDIFPLAIHEFARGTTEGLRITRHEFGHLIAEKIFGTVQPGVIYESIKNLDSYVPSEYSRNSLAEDFAEGIEAYLRTNAGQLDPATRSYLANRFSFYDNIFSSRSPQSVVTTGSPARGRQLNIIVKMIGETQLLAIAPEAGIGLLLELK